MPCWPGITNIVLTALSLVPKDTAVASKLGSYPARKPDLYTTAGTGTNRLCLIVGKTTKCSSPLRPSDEAWEQSV